MINTPNKFTGVDYYPGDEYRETKRVDDIYYGTDLDGRIANKVSTATSIIIAGIILGIIAWGVILVFTRRGK